MGDGEEEHHWELLRDLREGATHHEHSKVGEVVAPALCLATPCHCCTPIAVPAPRTGCARKRRAPGEQQEHLPWAKGSSGQGVHGKRENKSGGSQLVPGQAHTLK